MADVLITHEVDDYLACKHGFDNAAGLRKQAGELEYQVLQSTDDANHVVHFSKWRSHATAKSFSESPNVQKIRNRLGIKSPTIIYLDQTASGAL